MLGEEMSAACRRRRNRRQHPADTRAVQERVRDEGPRFRAPIVRVAPAAVALAIGMASSRAALAPASWLGLAIGAALWATRTRAARRAGPRWLVAIALCGGALAAREAAHARAIAAPPGTIIDDRDDDGFDG